MTRLRLIDWAFAALLVLCLVRGTAFDPFAKVTPADLYSDCNVILKPLDVRSPAAASSFLHSRYFEGR